MADETKVKSGLVLSLVACGTGVLGIFTPIIGLLFTVVTLILTIIALIKSAKAKYWPAVIISVVAAALVVAGLMTSMVFMALIGVKATDATHQKIPVTITTTPQTQTPEVTTPTPATIPSPPATPAVPTPTVPAAATASDLTPYLKTCEGKMTDYAIQQKVDPKLYIANNQPYLQQCAQFLAKNNAPKPASQPDAASVHP